MTDISSIIFLCVSLPSATERRADISEQAQRLGIHVRFIDAVAGKDLPPDVPEYNRKARKKCYHYDLVPNEVACTLSHIKALNYFLESEAKYTVIIEDDVFFSDNIKEGLHEAIHHIRGWEAAKLYIAEGDRTHSLGDMPPEGSFVSAVFPSGIMWASVAWMYTRNGAQILRNALQSFYLATDQQIGSILLQQRVPLIALAPALIGTYDPRSEQSSIGPRGAKIAKGRRSLLQYLRYRISVMAISRAKKRMIRMMRQQLRRI